MFLFPVALSGVSGTLHNCVKSLWPFSLVHTGYVVVPSDMSDSEPEYDAMILRCKRELFYH